MSKAPSPTTWFLRCLVWSLVCLAVTPAFAQSGRTSSKDTSNLLKIAEKLFLEGTQLAQKGKYEAALAKFRASYRIVPTAKAPKNERIRGTLHLLIGRTYHRMKQWMKARDHYRNYMRTMPNDSRRPKVKGWIRELQPHLITTLKLTVTPQGECVVKHPGGVWKGAAPASVSVEAGAVQVSCRAQMYKPGRLSFSLPPKRVTIKQLELQPLPKLPPPPADNRWVGIVIGAVGLAAIATGGVLGGVAVSERETAIKLRDEATTGTDSTNAWQTFEGAQQKAMLANVMYAAGGGLAITGVILYFVLMPRARTTTPTALRSTNKRMVYRFWQGTHKYESSVSSEQTALFHRLSKTLP